MENTQRARELRKNQTDAESLLWHRIRNRRLNGYKFKRQVPINRYIVDFLCSAEKLIIELDGGQHAEQIEYDKNRTRFLNSKGFSVVRFWNNEVLTNIEGVLESLTLTLSQRERGLKK